MENHLTQTGGSCSCHKTLQACNVKPESFPYMSVSLLVQFSLAMHFAVIFYESGIMHERRGTHSEAGRRP